MGGCESRESGKRRNNNGSAVKAEETMERNKRIESAVAIGVAVAAVVGVGLFAWGAASLLSSSSSSDSDRRKMMKAPGRDGAFIFRQEFEDDPAKYFRHLRKH